MAILLTILKIIGIVLLVILGLVLLIILLVLFLPISYRLSGVHNESETRVKASVSYMVVKALGSFEKDVGLDYKVKILFFQILPKKEKKDDGSQTSEQYLSGESESFSNIENQDASSNVLDSNQSLDHISENIISPQNSDDVLESHIDSDNNSDEVSLMSDLDELENDPQYIKELEKEEKIKRRKEKQEEKRRKKEEALAGEGQEKMDISDKIDNMMDKVEDGLNNLDKKIQDILVKLDHVLQLLDKDFAQRTLSRVFKILKRLFGTIKPKKSKAYLHLGLGSSADTGDILGKISMFYPLWGRWLNIEPDFYNKVIEGDLDIKGRIYLFRIVGPAIRMVLTRDFWRTIKLAKKI
ncbi:MAG: DUF2953 domain-containing protein [Eubacterium sp.]|nr:DUF2953 domain-containing protein [Eubacterium sp.]